MHLIAATQVQLGCERSRPSCHVSKQLLTTGYFSTGRLFTISQWKTFTVIWTRFQATIVSQKVYLNVYFFELYSSSFRRIFTSGCIPIKAHLTKQILIPNSSYLFHCVKTEKIAFIFNHKKKLRSIYLYHNVNIFSIQVYIVNV